MSGNALDESNRWSRDNDADRSIQVLEDCADLGLGRHVVITIGKYNADSFEKTIDYIVKNNIWTYPASVDG